MVSLICYKHFGTVLKANDFLQGVWYSKPIQKFRDKLLSTEINDCRHCIVFPQINL